MIVQLDHSSFDSAVFAVYIIDFFGHNSVSCW